MELFKASGFLYAEPLVIGTLQTMNSFPLGFESKLPAKFGLPALDKPNVAEGIVIKPLKNVVLDTKKGPKRVIFKRKVQGFAEVKSRGLGRGYKRQAEPWTPGGSSQDFELLRYEMLALITTQRAVNVISKLGRPCSPSQQAKKTESISASNNDCVGNSKESVETQTKKKSSETIPVDNLVEWKDIVQGLVKDVIEELESEYSELWTSCQRDKEKIRELMCKMRDQCIECVEEYKKSLME